MTILFDDLSVLFDDPAVLFDGGHPGGIDTPVENPRTPNVHLLYDGQFYPLECIDFQISLQSMPLDSADSSGGVGEISLSFVMPQDPDHPLNLHGYEWAYQKAFEAYFGKGYLTGKIVNGGRTENGNIVNYTATTAAHLLNAFNVAVPPASGTLEYAISRMIGHLEIPFPSIHVDPSIASRPVTYPGWTGEFWHHLKMLCAAEDIDILFTSNIVQVYPSRVQEVFPFRDTQRDASSEGASLAQFVEVYDYQNTWVENKLVYPVGGWNEDEEILSVGADEYVEHTLDLSTSLASFFEPEMREFVGMLDRDESVYTVSGDDGFPIKPQQWKDYGGDVSFRVGEEFNTLIVSMRGAKGIINDSGDEIQNFSLALSADTGGGSQYSTLRIIGTGTQYKRDTLRVGTGVPASETGTEVGATIDNPFLSTREQAFNAAIRSALKFQGYAPSLSISSQGMFDSPGVMRGETLTHLKDGGQVYRVRDVTYSPEGIGVSAEGDLRLRDLSHWELLDVEDWDQLVSDLTCLDVRIKGTRIG